MEGKIVNIISAERFTGDDGIEYVKYVKEILTPRKTFVKGEISGKYRGDRMVFENLRPNTELFDFEIYEAEVVCDSPENFSLIPFELEGKLEFPREKLPNHIPVSIVSNGLSYDVNILEPSLFDFYSIPKFRQVHGDEVYGRMTAYVTGYVLDHQREEIEEIVEYVEEAEVVDEPIFTSPPIVTGSEPTVNGYKKVYTSGGNSQWTYRSYGMPAADGCLGGVFGFIGLVLGLLFLIILIPNFFYVLLIGFVFFLFYYLAPILKWISRIVGAAFLLLFLVGMIGVITNGNRASSRIPRNIQDEREAISPVNPDPVVDSDSDSSPEDIPQNGDTSESEQIDEIIKRFRSWQDYDGNLYEGYYTVKKSDLDKSNRYKNAYQMRSNHQSEYDKLVHNLKENDKEKLSGLYGMFDSIQTENKLSKLAFAQMMVAMVQDIPYALVLQDDCDPKLYGDNRFISQYLSAPGAVCDPYEKFGINTPVEFITNLKGDCDTRTLLLYTILSHFGYDVILLSSDVYQHSILGVNLPGDGVTFNFIGTRYLVWETTARGIKPGIINPEMANMNYWRISLKSKTK
ncbi:MAG: hypothetical protein EOO50_00580 [Flavobacterium sp.]|uniref:hypothetical protein n=1 Tax=Flavobacterium sp. TaxID=239 RepID=UPI00121E2EBC|nr:hypothetical protein [Flavobacterium sp.]RZJ68708.1 MAG: hypothetical protein EOO50_00580 [Flavobacterium sp.]